MFLLLCTGIIGAILFAVLWLNYSRRPAILQEAWSRAWLLKLLKENPFPLPVMLVDMDVFEHNCKLIFSNIGRHNANKLKAGDSNITKLRVATKSVRCPALLKRIHDLAGQQLLSGWMCYSVEEVRFLAEQGLDHFYLAYPTPQASDLRAARELHLQGVDITLTVDSVELVQAYDFILSGFPTPDDVMAEGGSPKLKISIDIDMSFNVKWIPRLGAHRSRVDSVEKFAEICDAIKSSTYLRLVGVMGYEAHVAGLPDKSPYSVIPNVVVQFLKVLFQYQVNTVRCKISQYCRQNEIQLDFFNGGGSGNYIQAMRDPSVTEVTIGSAFLQGQLFDYYRHNHCLPAMAFALQITRMRRAENYIVCQSGGFVASGSCSEDKFPSPFTLANGVELEPFTEEGYGEVQTPLKIKGPSMLSIGQPMFFRPAKSGEIAEHFNEYHLKRGSTIAETVKTYRGFGHVFY